MTEEKLVRGIGRWDLTAIAINTIIGAGIFGLPSKVHALIGSYSLWSIIACAFIIVILVLCYAEVSSRFTATGGPYLYAKEAFGPVVGFEVGWLYWLVRVTSFAANCNLFVTYVGFFTPLSELPTVRMAIIAAIVRPPDASAARWATVSMPRAKPLTVVTPTAARSPTSRSAAIFP